MTELTIDAEKPNWNTLKYKTKMLRDWEMKVPPNDLLGGLQVF
jgi:hypothetical protein